VLFYGVSAETEKVVEFFLERDAGGAMIDDVREDEPVPTEDPAGRDSRARLATSGSSSSAGRDGAGRYRHARLSRRRKREAMTWALDGVR
jgi:hypothetical protein